MSPIGKTGSRGRPWVVLDSPKPPRVDDMTTYWQKPPPARSERCKYWVRQIERGFLPPRRIEAEDYWGKAHWFGVYLWEYFNVLWPMLSERKWPD